MRYNDAEIPEFLRAIAQQWRNCIENAKRYKEEVFGAKARECQQHYQGPKEWDELMGAGTPEDIRLQFKMHVNKAFEYVQLFGPYLYYDNPVRTVKPRSAFEIPPAFYPDMLTQQAYIAQEQQRSMVDGLRAAVLEKYLNWTPAEYRLDIESRLAISEALIKGRSCIWTELQYLPNGTKAAVSKWDSVDFLLVDPDAARVEEAKWISRRRICPTWEAEKRFGLRPGSLKGNVESQQVQGEQVDNADARYDRARGSTNDLIIYHEVWSKMGIGGRIKGMEKRFARPLDEMFGDYAYLVISKDVPFPLNMPPDLVTSPDAQAAQTVKDMVTWPIPFYMDDRWPVALLDLCPIHNCPWPMAPLMAARGELRFLSWIMSFLAGHIKNASRDFVAVQKSLNEEIKTTILHGADLSIIELDHDHGPISDAISFLQHPQVNGDIWTYIDAVEKSFERRTGLSEVMYGSPGGTQIRSASEANLRNENAGIRPDDMARQVAAWQADIAASEAGATRYAITANDILLPLGPMAASVWDTYVLTTDPTDAFKQLEYRIEAGSTRKPNKEFQVRQMTEAMQVMSPILMQYAQATTDLGPINALIQDWCKSRDLDPQRYMLVMAPQPSPLPSAAGAQPNPEGEMHSPPMLGAPAA